MLCCVVLYAFMYAAKRNADRGSHNVGTNLEPLRAAKARTHFAHVQVLRACPQAIYGSSPSRAIASRNSSAHARALSSIVRLKNKGYSRHTRQCIDHGHCKHGAYSPTAMVLPLVAWASIGVAMWIGIAIWRRWHAGAHGQHGAQRRGHEAVGKMRIDHKLDFT